MAGNLVGPLFAVCCALVCALALMIPLAANAESGDPTQPATWAEPSKPADGTPTQNAGPAVLVLESTLIPVRGRPLAIINGRLLALGDVINEAKLVRIREGEVVLRREGQESRLTLYPDVQIQSQSAKAGTKVSPKASAKAESGQRDGKTLP